MDQREFARLTGCFGLGVGLLVLGCGTASAQTNSYAACGAITDKAARYSCYDQVEKSAAGNAAIPRAGTPTPSPDASLENPFARRFGTAPPPAREAGIISNVQSFDFDSAGKFTVVLANGQVWHQFDADPGSAQFKRHSRNFVKVTHRFWKTYDLQINDQNAVYRVVRLK